METGFTRIAEAVKKHPKGKLSTLAHHINIATLEASYHELSGRKAAGVDGVTKAQYGEKLMENLNNLVERMKLHVYKPQAARRVYIPKDGTGKMRPLGMSMRW